MENRGILFRATICALFLFGVAGSLRSQGRLTATALNPLTGATSLYKLQFTSPAPLDSGAGFVLIFPSGFDLSRVSIAASSTILGGMTVRTRGREALVLRKENGPRIQAGRNVDLWLSAVKSASNAGPNQIALEVYSDKKLATTRFESDVNSSRPAAKLVGDVVLKLAPQR